MRERAPHSKFTPSLGSLGAARWHCAEAAAPQGSLGSDCPTPSVGGAPLHAQGLSAGLGERDTAGQPCHWGPPWASAAVLSEALCTSGLEGLLPEGTHQAVGELLLPKLALLKIHGMRGS